METPEKIYCSLDIETSGFDPLKDEILEVGFAFFQIKDSRLKILEEWSQVFKPTKAVPPQILGLTGISQKELDEAPPFSEHRDFIQAKLNDAIIVGHNVIFDIKFLEGFGIKCTGEIIDTLDLVQFLLPTHHSYNLENLMHTFGIAHKEAHRALADSKAVIRLLEKLLQIYSSFPKALKDQVKKLVLPQNLAWQDYLEVNFEPLPFKDLVIKTKPAKVKNKVLKLKSSTLYNFSLGVNYLPFLASFEGKFLLVVPKPSEALELYRQGLAQEAVFLPQFMFDKAKFEHFLTKKNLTPEESKFLLKILVWQHINWQTDTILDLNLSFFGGQFRNSISGQKIKENKTAKAVACDMRTFLYLSENGLYKNHQVMLCGLSEFEAAATSNIGSKASWGYIDFLLKAFYNPELNSGEEKYKEAVEAALLAGDLFFGLTNAIFQTNPPSFQYVKINSQTQNDPRYLKTAEAAKTYVEKIKTANLIFASKEVEKFISDLQNFFTEEDNRVKWIELSESRCAFLSMPLDITGLVSKLLKPFAGVSFADVLDENILPKFFLKRLGLDKYKIEQVDKNRTDKQGDLFSKVKKVFSLSGSQINYHWAEKAATSDQIMAIIGGGKNLPAAVLFPGPLQVKEFYEQNYQTLKQKASLLAQTAYGGSNKIFRNFGIHENSLLLATDKLILKHLTGGQNPVEPVTNLPVKTLILCRLPFDQFTHPYQEALANTLPNAFEDYSLPRALYNFHSILRFFYTPMLTDIYIIDSKLAKAYSAVFKNYLEKGNFKLINKV